MTLPYVTLPPPQRGIELSLEQKQEIVSLKRLLLAKMDSLMEERRALNHQIQTQFPQTTFHTRNAILYIKVCSRSATALLADPAQQSSKCPASR